MTGKTHYKTIIIGGGAAGMYLAALFARGGWGADVLLIERNARLGRKLSATGNGQGNVGNTDMGAEHYNRGGISDIISADVLTFLGGIFVSDGRGRIYPASRQASSVTDELRRRIDADVLLGVKAESVTKDRRVFTVSTGGAAYTSDNVVLACGGKAQKQFGTDGSGYALACLFGHSITPLYPSLVQLKTDSPHVKALKGLRADCRVTAKCGGKAAAAAEGEVIFADYGISGSAVFAVSPHIAEKEDVTLELEFLPEVTRDALLAGIGARRADGRRGEELLTLILHNQLARAVYALSDGSDEGIAGAAKHFPLKVTGTLGFDYAQVTRGGVDFAEVTEELESRLCPCLYFAGEILDVDGECGGYNLHWAFASAKRVYDSITRKSVK